MYLTFDSQDKRLSTIIPRNFTQSVLSISTKGIFLKLKNMYWVLFSFNKKSLSLKQSEARVDTWSLSAKRLSNTGFATKKGCIVSKQIESLSIKLGKHHRGQRTKHWGTLYFILVLPYFSLLEPTICSLSLRYESSRSRHLPLYHNMTIFQ